MKSKSVRDLRDDKFDERAITHEGQPAPSAAQTQSAPDHIHGFQASVDSTQPKTQRSGKPQERGVAEAIVRSEEYREMLHRRYTTPFAAIPYNRWGRNE